MDLLKCDKKQARYTVNFYKNPTFALLTKKRETRIINKVILGENRVRNNYILSLDKQIFNKVGSGEMIKRTVRIEMNDDMEVRPIAMLVQISSQCISDVQIQKGTRWVNAKSLLGMMTLDLGRGEEIEITTQGVDEESAMEKIAAFLGGVC